MSDPIKLHHRFEYAAFQAIAQTVGNLSLDAGTNFGAWLARFAGMRTSLRKRGDRNLAYAMPELSAEERKAILVDMFDSLTRTSVEYRHLQRLVDDRERIEVTGVEHLKAAHAAGQGAMLATGHFGNWEVIRIAFARHGWPPALIYREFNNPLFDAMARRTMMITDAPIFHKGRKGSLGMLRHVRGGGAALILTDQRFNRAPELPFFGKPAQTSLATAEIAQNYGAALLPVRGERIGRSSRFRVVIEPAIETEARSAEEVMTDVNARLEAWVRAQPGQYFWMHSRWGKAVLRSGKPQ